MECVQRWRPAVGMVVVEFSLAIVNVVFKKALNAGMDHVIIVLYRQSIAAVFLIPFVYLWERSSWNKLTARIIAQMFLGALFGVTLSQYLFLVGLDYTSATFTCAFINLVPVVTFILALALRMEKVNMKKKSGKGKVIGTLTCVVGATILSLYKGVRLINAGHGHGHVDVVLNQAKAKGLGTGSAFLFAGSIAWSSWFLIQSKIGHNFPYTYSSTSIMSLFSAFQSALFFLITHTTNMSKWILKGHLQILSVVYAGIVGSGLCYVVMSWCVKQKGPVFTSAFSPLIQIFAAIFDVLVLHEDVYLGSILGSVVVIIGMYVLLWGKSKDEQEICELPLPKKRIDEASGQDRTGQTTRIDRSNQLITQ